MTTKEERVKEAQKILTDLGMPKGQTNERSALTLLALLNLPHGSAWCKASSSLIGITPIMDGVRDNYDKSYKPNTRESVRRRTIHQFMQAAIVVQNPDMVRPINRGDTVYTIEPQ